MLARVVIGEEPSRGSPHELRIAAPRARGLARLGVEKPNTQAVLDGDLHDFMVAALAGQTRDKGGTGAEKPELTG